VFEALNVEIWFLMLAEGSTLGISLLFFLESLCELRQLRCARGILEVSQNLGFNVTVVYGVGII